MGQKHSLRNEFKLHNHNVSLYIQELLNSESTMCRVVHPLYPTADIPSIIKNTKSTRRADSTKMLCPQYSLLPRIAKGHNITPSHTRVDVLRHGNPLARKENRKCQNSHKRVAWCPRSNVWLYCGWLVGVAPSCRHVLHKFGMPYAISPRNEHALLSPAPPNHAQPAHGSTATPTSCHFFCCARHCSPPLLATLCKYSSKMRGACSRWDTGSQLASVSG